MPVSNEEIAGHILSREIETDRYQLNIDMYMDTLDDMPKDDPPQDVKQYMGTPASDLPITVPDDVVMKVAEYQHRDRLRKLVRTEMIQQKVSNYARVGLEKHLDKKLTPAEKKALIDAARAKKRA